MKIQDLINKTIEDIETYRHPSTEEFRNAINPILKAAGIGELLDGDTIEDIDINDDVLFINFTYSRMQCDCSGNYRLPMSIINNENPIVAASLWQFDEKIKEAKTRVSKAEKELTLSQDALQKIEYEKGIWCINNFHLLTKQV